jgi:hypothetical protein
MHSNISMYSKPKVEFLVTLPIFNTSYTNFSYNNVISNESMFFL